MKRKALMALNWLCAVTGVVWFGALFLVHFVTSDEMEDYRRGERNLWELK